MAYVDYEYYKSLYGEKAATEDVFNRFSWECCRKLDLHTTGIDGIKKLKIAFPTDEDDAEAVKRCMCKLIQISNDLEIARERVASAQGYIEREDGTVMNKLVSSVSAGNESISYQNSGSCTGATLVDKALADKTVEEQLYKDAIYEYLSGVTDANGVNLLYMGQYPNI